MKTEKQTLNLKTHSNKLSKFNSKATFNQNTSNRKNLTLTRNNFNRKIKSSLLEVPNQQNTNASLISNISKEVFDMDLKTIREILDIMKKHEIKCNEEGKFVEAGLLKERIEQFKKVEEIKVFDDIQKNHENQKNSLVFEQGDALARFNAEYDEIFNRINNDFMLKEKEISEKHKNEIERTKQDAINFFPEHPKPSAEIIQKHSVMKNLQKLKK